MIMLLSNAFPTQRNLSASPRFTSIPRLEDLFEPEFGADLGATNL